MHWSGFTCYSCGSGQERTFGGCVCPACGGNLEVVYDYASLKGMSRVELIQQSRGDMFRYLRLLPLIRPELASPLRVGMTPLYRAESLGKPVGLSELYIKDDGLNPSASFKDRAGAVALVRARETGAKVMAGASTGNAGSSMACLAASVGMPCVIFVPEKAPPAKIAQLLVFGAKVMAVRGTYDDAFDLCMKICERRGWFNRNTGYNPFTREGKKTCSFEICEQLGWSAPDRVVVATGDGNIISGIWKGMRELHAIGLIDRLPRIDCAQAEGSCAVSSAVSRIRAQETDAIDWRQVTFEPVAATTLADSISVDLPRDGVAAVRAVVESNGQVCTVSDDEILAAIPELARGAGVFAEPAAACAWAALRKMAKSGRVGAGERVVCLITGNGLKDVGAARRAAGDPIVIDADPEAAEAGLRLLGL